MAKSVRCHTLVVKMVIILQICLFSMNSLNRSLHFLNFFVRTSFVPCTSESSADSRHNLTAQRDVSMLSSHSLLVSRELHASSSHDYIIITMAPPLEERGAYGSTVCTCTCTVLEVASFHYIPVTKLASEGFIQLVSD